MTMRIFQKGINFSQGGPGNRLIYHLARCNTRCPWCANPEGMRMSDGREESVKSLLDEALRSRAMFFGGGVTLTGGECTCQFDAAREFLARLKDAGIDTAIETNATHPRLAQLFPLTDHLMLDFKHHDAERHLAETGFPLDAAIKNLRLALTRQGTGFGRDR